MFIERFMVRCNLIAYREKKNTQKRENKYTYTPMTSELNVWTQCAFVVSNYCYCSC